MLSTIPLTVSELTPEWLTAVLQERYPSVEVLTARTGNFIGFKPNKVIIDVTYNRAGVQADLPASFLLKGGFRNAGGGHAFSELDLGLTLELASYAEVIPHIDAVTPNCYWVDIDEANGAGAVLLRDLTPTGARFLKDQWSLSREEAFAFVKAIAKFHAHWMEANVFQPGGRFDENSDLWRRGDELNDKYLTKLTTKAYWERFSDMPRAAAVPRDLRDADRVGRAAERMYKVLAQSRSTVIHGDEHMGNLYLDGSGRAGFIDWCCRIAPWVIGYAYFIAVTLDPIDRRAWERDLLKTYLESLIEYGAGAPSFDEAWDQYRYAVLFPFMIWYNNSGTWQPETINTRNTQRAALAMLDHDTLGMLER